MTNFKDTYKETHETLARFDFTDRDSYFEWIRQWKTYYKELSQEIRCVKSTIKDRQRGKDPAASGSPPGFLKEMPSWRFYEYLHSLRSHATCALEMRAQGKKESWEMKLKAQELQKVS